jgi:hypothetical protein
MRHPHHHFVSAVLCGELDRRVQHRHENVEALDRELLLAEKRAEQVALEALDLGETGQKAAFLLRRQRRAVGAGLDRLAQPDAFLMV